MQDIIILALIMGIIACGIAIVGLVFVNKKADILISHEIEILKVFEEDLEAQLNNADTLSEILRRLEQS